MPEFGIPVTLRTPAGDLVFNQFGQASYLRLTGFSLSKPRRTSVLPYPQRDGGIKTKMFKSGAYVVLDGEVASFNDLTARAALLDKIRALPDSIADVEGTLLWTPSGQAPRQMAVTLLDDPGDGPGHDILKSFQLQLYAADPTTYGQALNTVNGAALAAAAAGTFVPTAFTFPITFGGASSGGIATVLNAGNAPSWPIIRIYGQITAPSVVNVTTGLHVDLPGLTLNVGQYAEIDMRRETVRLNGSSTSPLTAYLDNTVSNFWPLPAGTSVVQLTGTGYDANAYAAVIYRDGYA
jgi:spore coat protein U-like protein